MTGYNAKPPDEDYYPRGDARYGDGTLIPLTVKPNIFPVRIKGKMTNTPNNPHEDMKANSLMSGQISRGRARNGYYYKNEGEDGGSISAALPHESHIERL